MKNSKLKFSEYMQNIGRSKSFGKFVLIVYGSNVTIVEQAAKNNFHLKKDIFLAACVHYYTQPAAVKHLGNSNPYYKKK